MSQGEKSCTLVNSECRVGDSVTEMLNRSRRPPGRNCSCHRIFSSLTGGRADEATIYFRRKPYLTMCMLRAGSTTQSCLTMDNEMCRCKLGESHDCISLLSRCCRGGVMKLQVGYKNTVFGARPRITRMRDFGKRC